MTVRAGAWIRRSTLLALARVANAVFFLLTSLYCLLTYTSFAYQQFIRPHLVSWLTDFVVWHHLGYWLMLLITTWTLIPVLRPSPKPRAPGLLNAWSFLATSAVVGVILLVRPVLPQVENNSRGLVLALVALIPPMWLALVDHQATASTFAPVPSSESRAWKAALLAGAVVWVEQLVMIPWRLGETGEIALSADGIVLGAVTSGAAHFLISVMFAIVLVGVIRANRIVQSRASHLDASVDGRLEYWLIVALSGVIVMLVSDRLVFAPIAFTGGVAWLLSLSLGAMTAIVWSAVARIVQSETTAGPQSALDVWLAAVPCTASRAASIVALGSLVLVEFVALNEIVAFDWDFIVQKLTIVAIWTAAFSYSAGAIGSAAQKLRWPGLLTPAAAALAVFFGTTTFAQPRLAGWMGDATFVPEFALEGYVAVDPSYRLISGLLRVDSPDDRAFYAYLRANSLIQHVEVPPIDIDFVRPLQAAPAWKPNIFVFVVDSLRRDYVSPYNPRVRFTPAIGDFAKDGVVFTRAFTRYGGTGLSVPALWAGGMLLHKQYVTPFDGMNTLLKLINAEGYRRLMSMDSVVVQLIPRPPEADELDRGVPIVDYRLCHTLDDLQAKLEKTGDDRRPIFVYSLPQDLHISHVRSEDVPPGASYPGFVAPVAAQVERFDACFGRFVGFLKGAKLYDDSLIILTSDHGDSLGEGLRWGHSYTMFAEVARIPFIVHVPPRLLAQFTLDPDAVTLSTDVTPTLYRLTGHEPRDLGALYGRPFAEPRGADTSGRRTRPYVLASSYGGVYAVVRDNATRLFIADGVNSRDYAYDLKGEQPVRVGVTAEERQANRELIRQHIDEIGRAYHFTPAQNRTPELELGPTGGGGSR